ncbi:MAG: type IV secretory system conjugative DNA transfer family protein [Planctomycetaceae bacterium]|nr:type IV secretory system conjugative DNA transfer family protein [Planctomycetaceae bacterium]
MLISVCGLWRNEHGPYFAEKALEACHGLISRRSPLELILAGRQGSVGLYVGGDNQLRQAVRSQLQAAYPDALITDERDDKLNTPPDHTSWTAELWLCHDIYPIRRHSEYADAVDRKYVDPVSIILSALPSGMHGSVQADVSLCLRPCPARRRWATQKVIRQFRCPFFCGHPLMRQLFLQSATSPWASVRVAAGIMGAILGREFPMTDDRDGMNPVTHFGESLVEAAKDKCGRNLFETRLVITVSAPPTAKQAALNTLRRIEATFDAFGMPRLAFFQRRFPLQVPLRHQRRGFLMSAEELATLWHVPTEIARSLRVVLAPYRQLEAPVDLPGGNEVDVTLIGRTHCGRDRRCFGIRPDDRRRHLFVVGKTGMGKSTLLFSMMMADLVRGRGVALFDPHGDLAEQVVANMPRHRTNDVVLCDIGDRGFPVAFNPLTCRPDQRPPAASGIVSSFKRLFADSWGPRLEHILRCSVLTLLETPGSTLVQLSRLLQDTNFRLSTAGRVADPVLRAFWQEFSSWNDRYRSEAIGPVTNKLGFFLSNPIIRNVIGQSHGKVSLRSIMDNEQVLILNLSKGRIGEDACSLLGSFFLNSLQLAAMSRADIPESERRDFFCFVDEVQNFATDSLATVLSEARKYRAPLLTLANQYLGQLEEDIAGAIFGNVGSLISFAVGAEDSEFLSRQFSGIATPTDLVNLPMFTACTRLLVNGISQRPFTLQTLPPLKNTHLPCT